MKTQTETLLSWLKDGHTITSMEAFELFGITRLSARIFELRKAGHNIVCHQRTGKTRYGTTTTFAVYKLEV